MAGFAVGACEKSKVVTGEKVVEGDVLVGIASSGIHSNGFSLVRHIVLEEQGYKLDEYIAGFEELGKVGTALLEPTKIYAKPVMQIHEELDVHSMGHITGGGFYENLPRMFGEGFGVEVDLGSWPVLPVFKMLKEKGELQDKDMYSVFNMGIGFVIALPAEQAKRVIQIAAEHGEEAYEIGRVVRGEGVIFKGDHDGSLAE